MGRVWLIVVISMCLVFAASWIWHINGMNVAIRRDKAIDDPVIFNIERISIYRDVLKEKGKSAALEYLTTINNNTDGN